MDESKRAELKTKLEAFHVWPSAYMYKFIFPSNDETLVTLKSIFPEEVEFSQRSSSSGKYTSVSIKEMVLNAEVIFQRYEDVSSIEGIIAL